jgi:hypothetical protein
VVGVGARSPLDALYRHAHQTEIGRRYEHSHNLGRQRCLKTQISADEHRPGAQRGQEAREADDDSANGSANQKKIMTPRTVHCVGLGKTNTENDRLNPGGSLI